MNPLIFKGSPQRYTRISENSVLKLCYSWLQDCFDNCINMIFFFQPLVKHPTAEKDNFTLPLCDLMCVDEIEEVNSSKLIQVFFRIFSFTID